MHKCVLVEIYRLIPHNLGGYGKVILVIRIELICDVSKSQVLYQIACSAHIHIINIESSI